MGSFSIKLCDGFKLYNGVQLVLTTEDWQEVREWLGVAVDSQNWSNITREVFALGWCHLVIKDKEGRESNIYIEVIPCAD